MMEERKEDCVACNKIVKMGDKGVACDNCKDWYHIKCAQIKSELYQAMKNFESYEAGLHWFCAKCNKNVLKCLEEIEKLKSNQSKMEKEIENLKIKRVTWSYRKK